MAFFKSRSSGNASADDKNADGLAAQSLDTLRRQARHRLIGATVLVLLAVIGFPLVFDTKPREVAADIRIDMPDKDAVRSSQAPTPPPSVVPVPDAELSIEPKAAEVAPKAVVPPSVMPESPQQAAAKEEEVPSKPDANSAKSGETAPRFIVQVGAFADQSKSKEVRSKLEKAGIKTYTHIAQTKEGKRIRVRVGPFATKEEAQKTVDKIKSLQLSATVLTL
jgi:DedD protein